MRSALVTLTNRGFIMAKRDTFLYTMRSGNTIQKFGITNNPERRERENHSAGVPGVMRLEGSARTRRSALNLEGNKIVSYRQRNGRLPQHNKF